MLISHVPTLKYFLGKALGDIARYKTGMRISKYGYDYTVRNNVKLNKLYIKADKIACQIIKVEQNAKTIRTPKQNHKRGAAVSWYIFRNRMREDGPSDTVSGTTL